MREYGVVDSWSQVVVGPFQDVDKFFGCMGSGELVFSRDLKILNKNNLGIEDLETKVLYSWSHGSHGELSFAQRVN